MTLNDRTQNARSIGPFIVAGGGFDSLYRDGMKLVEDAAAYLDSDGRAESKALDRDTSLLYASQSMHLTTRLMQLASWLLLQRAVKEGELTLDQALSEDRRVELSTEMADKSNPVWANLPQQLRDLVDKADSINKRIQALDKMGSEGEMPQEEAANPVNAHLAKLRNAFGGSQAE